MAKWKPFLMDFDCPDCGFEWRDNRYINWRCPRCSSRIGLRHVLYCFYQARLKHWKKYGGVKPIATDRILLYDMRPKEGWHCGA